MEILKKTSQEKPVEVTGALAMVLSGIVIAAAGGGTWFPILGGALATLGGVLLSWSTASVYTEAQAAAILRPQLEGVARHLGTTAGQIGRAVSDAEAGVIEEDVCFALVSQGVRSLYGTVTDIHVLTQTTFDASALVETAGRIDELADSIAALATAAPDDRPDGGLGLQLAGELRMLVDQLRKSAAPSSITRERVAERVACPSCSAVVRCDLGVNTGDTAQAVCGGCGDRFNLHRLADQTVLKRPATSALGPRDQRMEGETEGVAILATMLSTRLNFPFLNSEHFDVLFDAAADVINKRLGNFTAVSKAVRDQCAERGYPISRSNVDFILKGLQYRGISFVDSTTKESVRAATITNVVGLCERNAIELDPAQRKYLDQWMGAGESVPSHGAGMEGAEGDA